MNSRKLRAVIDRNILLVSVSSTSQYHRIFQKIPDGEPDVFATNGILTEYEEIIASKFIVFSSTFVLFAKNRSA